MAEDIKQTLGFDASQALDTLSKLDQALASFESKIGTLANSALVNFNSRAGKTVAALQQITDAANAAAAALGKVNAAQNTAGGGTAGGASPSRARASTSSLLTGQDAADAFNKLLGNQTNAQATAADKLTKSLRDLGDQAADTFSKGEQAAAKFTISWETLTRVVVTQFIVRALSALRDAFNFSVAEAINFQRAIARIQTIAGGAGFGEIADGVRKISDSFNIPLLQAAEGVYQAVSNQVGNLSESLTFAGTAAQFAKATNSSLADSIDLLSGAIKSFNLDVNSAEKVAGIFFTAIDKGRVTASELANTFGRVGPSAAEIGISLEELAGGIAAISVKGVKTNESLTQFRGIITALTKPTDAMKEKLAQLGFSTAEAGVQALGLDGLLERLAKSTGGTSNEFAKLFPNVRGLGGALSLTGKNLEEFVKDIRAGQDVVAGLNNEKFGTVFQTDAEKVTTAVNKIKTALIVDFGQAVLASAKGLLDLTGGAETLIGIGSQLVPVLVNTGVAIGAIALSLGAARVAALLFANSLGVVGTAATATVLAVGAIKKAIDDARLDFANKATAQLTKNNAEAATAFAKAERDKNDAAKKADQERVKSALEAVAAINKTYLQDVENAKAADKALVDNTDRTLDKIINARVQFVEAITKAITDSQQAIRDSNRRISDLRLDQQDLQFNRRTENFSDAQKAFVLIQRAAQTATQAQTALDAAFRSGNKGDEEAAQKLFDRANTQLNAAKSLANGNNALETKVFNEQNGLIQRRIDAEQRINQLQLQRQTQLKQEKAQQEQVIADLRTQAKIVVENTGQFDKNGEQFNAKQQQQRAAAREAALKKIATTAFNQKDFDVGKALGLGDFLSKIQDDVTKRPIQVQFQIEKSIAQFRAELTKSLGNIDVQLPFLKNLESALGKSLRSTPDGIRQGIQEAVSEADVLRNKLSQVKINDQSIENARAEIQSLLDSINARKGVRDQAKANTNDPEVRNAIDNVDRFAAELQKLASQSKITQEDIDAIRAKIQNNGSKAVLQIDTDLNQLGQIAARIGPIKTALESTANVALPPDAQARLAVLNDVLRQIGAVNPGLQLQTAATALQNTVTPVQTIGTTISQSATDAERIQRAYEAASRVQLPAVPATAGTKFPSHGGMIQGFNTGGFVKAMRYFDRGGWAPKGTDTIPAMLTPGEFVVNAHSTKRFFSQLQAINAGRQPIFRANGGSVTNNSIGDVSIAVNGAQSPKVVAREVMQAITREKRRNTARL